MRYIHEARFGPPKAYKTGSVVETYPKPMVVFEFDAGGLDIIKNQSSITTFTPAEFLVWHAKNEAPQTPIVCIDFAYRPSNDFTTDYVPMKDKETFDMLAKCMNSLRKYNPFKTVVVDPVTSLSDAIWRHQAVMNSAALSDPRKWAGNIGMKVSQIIEFINGLQCNTVFIFHSEIEKNELSGETRVLPMVHSKVREIIGGKFSQFFYQEATGKDQAELRWTSFGNIKGIGTRWPAFKNERIAPDFNSIYGSVPDVFK